MDIQCRGDISLPRLTVLAGGGSTWDGRRIRVPLSARLPRGGSDLGGVPNRLCGMCLSSRQHPHSLRRRVATGMRLGTYDTP